MRVSRELLRREAALRGVSSETIDAWGAVALWSERAFSRDASIRHLDGAGSVRRCVLRYVRATRERPNSIAARRDADDARRNGAARHACHLNQSAQHRAAGPRLP
jgi:hypothetical protein